jgi:uncharacterized protein YggE
MKDFKIHPIYIVLGILTFFAFRTPSGDDYNASSDRVITVTGSADMLVPPDEVSLDISYREYWHVANKKKESITEIEKDIIEAADEAGISKDNIVINTAYAWKHRWNYWHYWWDYYNHLVEKNLTVKVKNSAQLNQLIQNLKDSNIHRQAILNIQLNGSSNKKIQDYRKMVKERAVQAAQEKADYLLSALGEKRGVVINITELSDPQTNTKTTSHGEYPYFNPYWVWGGGYGGSTTINNGGMNAVSNSSVSMPSGGGHSSGNENNDGLGMKPIKLRYEIQAVFKIAAN